MTSISTSSSIPPEWTLTLRLGNFSDGSIRSARSSTFFLISKKCCIRSKNCLIFGFLLSSTGTTGPSFSDSVEESEVSLLSSLYSSSSSLHSPSDQDPSSESPSLRLATLLISLPISPLKSMLGRGSSSQFSRIKSRLIFFAGKYFKPL